MEFLQIQPDTHVYEGDLEQALIDHLQHFLLELGRGFSFVARQKRFTLDGQDFFIDLVFYNYILKCFVLIDLKMGKLTHQDLGQMQMYVNYYTREMMNEGDTQPIGIVLCADKGDSCRKASTGHETRVGRADSGSREVVVAVVVVFDESPAECVVSCARVVVGADRKSVV